MLDEGSGQSQHTQFCLLGLPQSNLALLSLQLLPSSFPLTCLFELYSIAFTCDCMFVGPRASLVNFLASWGHRQPEDVCPVCEPYKPSQLSPAYGSCWTCTFIVCLFLACTVPWAGRRAFHPWVILPLFYYFLTLF